MAIESKMNRGPIGAPKTKKKQPAKNNWTWIIVLVIVAILGGGWFYMSGPDSDVDVSEIGSGEYQAVFLDNGQVYFGKLDSSDDRFYTLTDVFYLQSGAVAIDQTSNLALTKLGNEAHGPEDRMLINTDHILFIEDMKNDSKVVQAINDYKNAR